LPYRGFANCLQTNRGLKPKATLSWLNRRRLLAGNIGKCRDFAQTGAVQLGPFEKFVSSFAPQKQRYFRGAKGDFRPVISRAVLTGTKKRYRRAHAALLARLISGRAEHSSGRWVIPDPGEAVLWQYARKESRIRYSHQGSLRD